MRPPVILFGAFDRHNLGDLLLAHVAAALLRDRDLRFAGLADRDLRRLGGHRVQALARVVAGLGGRPAELLHVGGEILGCDAWQAAVMLSQDDEARRIVARLHSRPRTERFRWAREVLGTPALAPYSVARGAFPNLVGVAYAGVGGVDLDAIERDVRDEVLANLAGADAVSVRDRRTRAHLAAAGIAAQLAPDAAVMVAELFGDRIRRRAGRGEVARLREAFPRGYLAVQFSADFGDDATLSEIAAQLGRATAAARCGVALFRAGAAPWHDDVDVLGRVAARMRAPSARVFESLDIWDVCALLASARAYCGSSLHGRIVAMAFGLPRVGLRHPRCAAGAGKQAAFADAWEAAGVPATVGVDGIADGIALALATDPQRLLRAARELPERAREAFGAIASASGTRAAD